MGDFLCCIGPARSLSRVLSKRRLGHCRRHVRLPGAHDREPEHGRDLTQRKRLAKREDLVLVPWEQKEQGK